MPGKYTPEASQRMHEALLAIRGVVTPVKDCVQSNAFRLIEETLAVVEAEPEGPDVVIEVRKGLPYLVRNREKVSVEVRDFDTQGLVGGVGAIRYDDSFLPHDEKTGEAFYRHVWQGNREGLGRES